MWAKWQNKVFFNSIYLFFLEDAANVSRGIGLAVTKQTPTVTKQTLQSPNSSCSHQTAPSLFNDLKINIYYHF